MIRPLTWRDNIVMAHVTGCHHLCVVDIIHLIPTVIVVTRLARIVGGHMIWGFTGGIDTIVATVARLTNNRAVIKL